ncbi:MAG: nucleoside diphosphate kinase regulator [Aurantimonas endophytica]|uniref:nucleoside diphosphate kinase regulator n=1 Tax=Aurantimonas endophytica TaxID=1522175 RepID=UPI003002FBFA
MAPGTQRLRKPQIKMTRSDHERLSRLANALSSVNSNVADQLFTELDRARVIDDSRIAADTVRMESTLRYTTDGGEDRTVTLVFPGEADIAKGRVSLLTPIGIALIGLSAGQSMDWTTRDGRIHRLTVESVEVPAQGAHDQSNRKLQSA